MRNSRVHARWCNPAEADPNVAKYAALDLQSAKQELQVAENAAIRITMRQPRGASRVPRRADCASCTTSCVGEGRPVMHSGSLLAKPNAIKFSWPLAPVRVDTATSHCTRSGDGKISQPAGGNRCAQKQNPRNVAIAFTLGDVLFDTGRAELKPGAARNLDQLAQFPQPPHPDRRIQIDGFTDSRGQ